MILIFWKYRQTENQKLLKLLKVLSKNVHLFHEVVKLKIR